MKYHKLVLTEKEANVVLKLLNKEQNFAYVNRPERKAVEESKVVDRVAEKLCHSVMGIYFPKKKK